MDIQGQADLIAAEVAPRYGVGAGSLQLIGGFRNQVYEFEREEERYILRVSSGSARTAAQVAAELDWVRYLDGNGLSVTRAVPSLAGNWVETMNVEGRDVPVCVFVKAPGQPPGEVDWNEQLFRKMGRFLGTMHRLTKEYMPTDAARRRPAWWEDLDVFASRYLSAVDEAVQARWQEIRSYPEHLPQNRDAFGLVHVDFHRGNFFLHGGKLTLFDFDDSIYSWFAEDLAMALFYSVWPLAKLRENAALPQTFFRAFLAGYREENDLAEHWLMEIPHFLKQREICLYMVLTALGKEQWHESAAQFMSGRRESILNNTPYLNIDLTGFITY